MTSRGWGFLIVVALVAAPLLAGPPNPAGGPNTVAGAQFTLGDIYARLNAGTPGAKRAVATVAEPLAGPGTPTMFTTDDIMTKAPVQTAAAATPGDVGTGKKFWGLSLGAWGPQTGTYVAPPPGPPAPVPQTKQTCTAESNVLGECPGVPPGQDAELHKGVVWTAETRFTAANGVVTDNLTGLIWLQNANCANAARNWGTAFSDVASLNSVGTTNGNACGDTSAGGTTHQTDWRLPNVREQQSLIDYANFNPPLPTGHPFSNVQNYYYWTSSVYPGYPGYVWFVDLYHGSVNGSGKGSTYSVWPVRGGQ